jgi:hypothetical protein
MDPSSVALKVAEALVALGLHHSKPVAILTLRLKKLSKNIEYIF